MIIQDKNLWLSAPEGYEVEHVSAQGAFLLVRYNKTVRDGVTVKGVSYVEIFLNDQGREVLRTEKFYRHTPPPEPAPKPVMPDTFLGRLKQVWDQIWDADDSSAF